MRKRLIALFLMLPLALWSQVLKERRVYYLDCSYSMISNKIWNEVCDNLKNAIDDIGDETTELIVIPFALDHDGGIDVFTALANEVGKNSLKKQIDAINPNKSSMTYHKVPLEDFYNHRVQPAKVTYMFLMTDGQDEWKEKNLFPDLLKQWGNRYGNKNVYGFYVMLHKSARNAQVESICDSQSHLWQVETANINVNLIRLQPKVIFNARNDKYLESPIYGDFKGINFSTSFDSSAPYTVTKSEVVNGKLRIYVRPNLDIYSLPQSQKKILTIKISGAGKYDFLVTDKITVQCESKPERSLKISIR